MQRRVTESEIANLVERFYAKVRVDPALGPIFAEAVEDWDAHIALLKDFWSTVLLTTMRYKGNPMMAHLPLRMEERHFGRWLELFRETAAEVMPPAVAASVVSRAEQIAGNMQRVFAAREVGAGPS